MKKLMSLTLMMSLLPWSAFADNFQPLQNSFITVNQKEFKTQMATEDFNFQNRRNSGDALFDIFHQDLTTPKSCQVNGVNILLDNSCHLGNYRLKDNESKEERKPSDYGIRSFGSESVYCRQCKKSYMDATLNSADVGNYKSLLQERYKQHKSEKWIEKLAQIKKKFKFLQDELANRASYNSYNRDWAINKMAMLKEKEQVCAGDKVVEQFKATLQEIAQKRSEDESYNCSGLSNLQTRFKFGGLNTTTFEDKYYNRARRGEDDNNKNKAGFANGITEYLNQNLAGVEDEYKNKVSFTGPVGIQESDYCSQYDTSVDGAFSTREDDVIDLAVQAIGKNAKNGSVDWTSGQEWFRAAYLKKLESDPRFDDFQSDDPNGKNHLPTMVNMWADEIFRSIKEQPELVDLVGKSNNYEGHEIKKSFEKQLAPILVELSDQEAVGYQASIDKLMIDCEKQHGDYIKAIACSNDELDMTEVEMIAQIDPLVSFCPILSDSNERAKRKPEIDKAIADYNKEMSASNSEFDDFTEKDLDYRCAAFKAVTCSASVDSGAKSIPEKPVLAEMINDTNKKKEQDLIRQDLLNEKNQQHLSKLSPEKQNIFLQNTKESSCAEIVKKCEASNGGTNMSLEAMNLCFANSWSSILQKYAGEKDNNQVVASFTTVAVYNESTDNICKDELITKLGIEAVLKMNPLVMKNTCEDLRAEIDPEKIVYKTSVNTAADESYTSRKGSGLVDNNDDSQSNKLNNGLAQDLLKNSGVNTTVGQTGKQSNSSENNKKSTPTEPAYNAPKSEWIDYTKNVVSNVKTELKDLNKEVAKLEKKKNRTPEEDDELDEKRKQRDLLKKQTEDLEAQIANLKKQKDETKDQKYLDEIDVLKKELADTKGLLKKKNKTQSSPQTASSEDSNEEDQFGLGDKKNKVRQNSNVITSSTPTPAPGSVQSTNIFNGSSGPASGGRSNPSQSKENELGGVLNTNTGTSTARAGVQVGGKLDTFEDKDLMSNDSAPTLYITSEEQYGNLNVKIDEYLKNPEMCKNGCSPDKPFRIIVTYNPNENTTGKIKQNIKTDGIVTNKVSRSIASENIDPKKDEKKDKKRKTQSFFEDDLEKEIDKALK